jgi:hypothetical protein
MEYQFFASSLQEFSSPDTPQSVVDATVNPLRTRIHILQIIGSASGVPNEAADAFLLLL